MQDIGIGPALTSTAINEYQGMLRTQWGKVEGNVQLKYLLIKVEGHNDSRTSS